jgi:hypothetical protein
MISLLSKMEEEEEVQKKDKRKPYTKTVYEYASVCTPHGIFYIFESDRWLLERGLWIVVVCILTGFAIGWSVSAYNSWKEFPILTSVATTGYPIEKVPFPSITICAQGAANDIVDAALFKQFERYLTKKKLNFTALSTEDQIEQTQSFLTDTYPGATKSPNQLVRMIGSPEVSVESKIESVAILNPNEFKNPDCPEVESPNNGRRKRQESSPTLYVEDTCPDGFTNVGPSGSGACVHMSTNNMTYDDAVTYCENQGDGNAILLAADPDEDIQPLLEELYSMIKIGKYHAKLKRQILYPLIIKTVVIQSNISKLNMF